MVPKRGFYFLLVLILITIQITNAQKAKYNGEIVYRLSQQVTWPKNEIGYKFIIGVVGNTSDYRSFQKIAVEEGEFLGIPIEVRYFECTEEIEECNLIYISEECNIGIKKIIRKTKDSSSLIVSGKEGYGKAGSIINFLDTEGKIKFELNQEKASKRGLQFSEQLRAISIVI